MNKRPVTPTLEWTAISSITIKKLSVYLNSNYIQRKQEGLIVTVEDKRKHPRFYPKDVHAAIVISNPENEDRIYLEGNMLDMSYSGVRIKLSSAMPQNLPDSNVKIVLTMPNSGVCCTIKGAIRHINDQSDFGLHYADHHDEQDVDAFMFECIKHIDTPLEHNREHLV